VIEMLYPLRPTEADREQLVSNIVKVYRSATPAQRARGKTWYDTAHDIAILIGGDVKVGAGVIAVLSAQRQWLETIRLAQHAVTTLDVRLDGKQLKTFNDQEQKVKRIMRGEDPETVLPMARKTGQFYLCIVNPAHPHAVVVDRHAHDIAVGRPYGDAPRGLSAIGRYEIFAQAYREAARRLKVKPLQAQAVTWVVWTELLDAKLGKSHRGWAG
jgi:hypothetical protein